MSYYLSWMQALALETDCCMANEKQSNAETSTRAASVRYGEYHNHYHVTNIALKIKPHILKECKYIY